MRSRSIVATTIAGLLSVAAGGCSSPDSYIVLSLGSTTPITGVADIQVDVSKGVSMRSLTYAAHGMMIDQTPRTLSVGLSGSETGTVTFVVTLRDNLGCAIGTSGTTPVPAEIKKGNVAFATVMLAALAAPDCSHVDGGTPDVADGSTLPGCDPTNPQSSAPGVATCSATQTCQVDCTPPDAGAPRNECIAGGAGPAGSSCVTNADCQPGTQCFNYGSTGCNVKLCLKFCNNDVDCAPVGAGGAGPGSLCQGPVMCPTFLTAYHTCTFNCDPRAAGAATRGGCPMEMACVMPGSMDEVDCACATTRGTKTEGMACTSAADCAPGFICNRMSGNMNCRAICRCDANASGACTATANDCPTAGTSCHAVTNNTIYGICL
jgi:hypothetical protein